MLSALNLRSNLQAFRELVLLLTRHRQLTMELARREISDRYAGQFFGLLWAIGHPLVLMLVYVFIFSFVFKVRVSGNSAISLDYSTYILSGLIPGAKNQRSCFLSRPVVRAGDGCGRGTAFFGSPGSAQSAAMEETGCQTPHSIKQPRIACQ